MIEEIMNEINECIVLLYKDGCNSKAKVRARLRVCLCKLEKISKELSRTALELENVGILCGELYEQI